MYIYIHTHIYIYTYIYIYIYGISSLRVNDLTLILLTWRKWWTNNASKWQMGFNSAFKGLNGRKWSVEKCSEVEWSVVGWSVVKVLVTGCLNIIRRYIDHVKSAAFNGFSFIIFLHVILALFIIVYTNGCMFCILLFNSVSYVFLLLCLCILIVMYALFCIFCFHRSNWHSSATLTEVFPCFFLSCKANVRV